VTLLPIVEREMRVAARRPKAHWLRLGAAVAALGLVFVIFASHRGPVSSGEASKLVFMSLSVLAFGFTLLAGVFLTADCVCSERRDGTLELLFLTDLKGYDIALGKLAATSLAAAFALLALVPVLGLPLLIGGVTRGEVARMSLALGVILLFSLTTGLCCSTFCRDTRSAMGTTFAVILLLTGVLFLPVLFLLEVPRLRDVDAILTVSPLGAFLFALDFYYTRSVGPVCYWTSIGFLALLTLVQLAVTCWRLPRATQPLAGFALADGARARPRPSSLSVYESRTRTKDEDERGHRQRVLGNPYLWLLQREEVPSRLTQLLLGLAFTLALGSFVASVPTWGRQAQIMFFVIALFSTYGLHVILKGVVAAQACRRLSEDRRSGALELLLATPLPPVTILEGQWQALWEQFGGWLKRATLLNGLLFVAVLTASKHYDMDGQTQAIFSLFFLGGTMLLFLDFRALGWLAMAEALRGQRQHRIVLPTLARLLLPGWLVIFVFLFVSIGSRSGPDEEALVVFYLVWALGNALLAIITAHHCRREAVTLFRRLAAGEEFQWKAGEPWPAPVPPALGESVAKSPAA
jgi:ABC-type transport system involved in multi-copper enzyme maturation permease subunit